MNGDGGGGWFRMLLVRLLRPGDGAANQEVPQQPNSRAHGPSARSDAHGAGNTSATGRVVSRGSGVGGLRHNPIDVELLEASPVAVLNGNPSQRTYLATWCGMPVHLHVLTFVKRPNPIPAFPGPNSSHATVAAALDAPPPVQANMMTQPDMIAIATEVETALVQLIADPTPQVLPVLACAKVTCRAHISSPGDDQVTQRITAEVHVATPVVPGLVSLAQWLQERWPQCEVDDGAAEAAAEGGVGGGAAAPAGGGGGGAGGSVRAAAQGAEGPAVKAAGAAAGATTGAGAGAAVTGAGGSARTGGAAAAGAPPLKAPPLHGLEPAVGLVSLPPPPPPALLLRGLATTAGAGPAAEAPAAPPRRPAAAPAPAAVTAAKPPASTGEAGIRGATGDPAASGTASGAGPAPASPSPPRPAGPSGTARTGQPIAEGTRPQDAARPRLPVASTSVAGPAGPIAGHVVAGASGSGTGGGGGTDEGSGGPVQQSSGPLACFLCFAPRTPLVAAAAPATTPVTAGAHGAAGQSAAAGISPAAAIGLAGGVVALAMAGGTSGAGGPSPYQLAASLGGGATPGRTGRGALPLPPPPPRQPRLPVTEALEVLICLAEALRGLHRRGLTHGSLMPKTIQLQLALPAEQQQERQLMLMPLHARARERERERKAAGEVKAAAVAAAAVAAAAAASVAAAATTATATAVAVSGVEAQVGKETALGMQQAGTAGGGSTGQTHVVVPASVATSDGGATPSADVAAEVAAVTTPKATAAAGANGAWELVSFGDGGDGNGGSGNSASRASPFRSPHFDSIQDPVVASFMDSGPNGRSKVAAALLAGNGGSGAAAEAAPDTSSTSVSDGIMVTAALPSSILDSAALAVAAAGGATAHTSTDALAGAGKLVAEAADGAGGGGGAVAAAVQSLGSPQRRQSLQLQPIIPRSQLPQLPSTGLTKSPSAALPNLPSTELPSSPSTALPNLPSSAQILLQQQLRPSSRGPSSGQLLPSFPSQQSQFSTVSQPSHRSPQSGRSQFTLPSHPSQQSQQSHPSQPSQPSLPSHPSQQSHPSYPSNQSLQSSQSPELQRPPQAQTQLQAQTQQQQQERARQPRSHVSAVLPLPAVGPAVLQLQTWGRARPVGLPRDHLLWCAPELLNTGGLGWGLPVLPRRSGSGSMGSCGGDHLGPLDRSLGTVRGQHRHQHRTHFGGHTAGTGRSHAHHHYHHGDGSYTHGSVGASVGGNRRFRATAALLTGQDPSGAMSSAYGITPACDVYALGLLMWHLVTGQVPFDHLGTQEVVRAKELGLLDEQLPFSDQLPLSYIALARRCWSPLPMQRPAMHSVLVELRSLRLQLLGLPNPTLPEVAFGFGLAGRGGSDSIEDYTGDSRLSFTLSLAMDSRGSGDGHRMNRPPLELAFGASGSGSGRIDPSGSVVGGGNNTPPPALHAALPPALLSALTAPRVPTGQRGGSGYAGSGYASASGYASGGGSGGHLSGMAAMAAMGGLMDDESDRFTDTDRFTDQADMSEHSCAMSSPHTVGTPSAGMRGNGAVSGGSRRLPQGASMARSFRQMRRGGTSNAGNGGGGGGSRGYGGGGNGSIGGGGGGGGGVGGGSTAWASLHTGYNGQPGGSNAGGGGGSNANGSVPGVGGGSNATGGGATGRTSSGISGGMASWALCGSGRASDAPSTAAATPPADARRRSAETPRSAGIGYGHRRAGSSPLAGPGSGSLKGGSGTRNSSSPIPEAREA